MRISVIIPAFNEERLIGETLREVGAARAAFSRRAWSSELIVCDNNSTDRTAELARAAGARVVEMLADYQALHNGGDAWLRLLRFDPARGEIQVRTYSPALKDFKTDPKHQFVVPWDIPACCRQAKSGNPIK